MCKHSQGWTSIGVNELGNWLNCNSCHTTRLDINDAKSAELQAEKEKLKIVSENVVKGVIKVEGMVPETNTGESQKEEVMLSLEQRFDEALNEGNDPVVICGMTYLPSEVLALVDPIGYRELFLAFVNEEEEV